MLLDKIKQMNRFSEAEKAIAIYILNNPDLIVSFDAKTIAKLSYTSPATVTRFVKTLGYDGFINFKIDLISSLQQEKEYQNKKIDYESTIPDTIKNLPANYLFALERVSKQLDVNLLAKVVYLLRSADNIDFYSTGINYGIVKASAIKFINIGVHVNSHHGLNTHYINQIVKDNRKVVSVLVSLSGINETIDAIAKQLSENNLPFISIGKKDSVVGKLSDIHIDCESDHDLEYSYLTLPISLMFILDILYVQLNILKM